MVEQFPFLENVYLGNTVLAYGIAAAIFVATAILLWILEKIILSKLRGVVKNTDNPLDDFFLITFEKTLKPLLYVTAFYFGIRQLTLSDAMAKFFNTVFVVVLVFQLTRLVLALVLKYLDNMWLQKSQTASKVTTTKTIMTVLKIVVWGVATVFLLDNLGFNVSAVVAGLGISGIAVAFALQAILGDLFNYFVIFFDRPFEEGDFVIVDDYLGVIEHIGIKTTRIRSLSGEQIIFSNSDLTGSRIRNYKRMQQRRVLFGLGVTYQTSLEKMKVIPEIIQKVVENVEETRFDRAHFKGFGDFSLDIEVVYYVLSSDYNKYMDIQEKINLQIQEAFEKEGIEFAYPTQTLFVEKTEPVAKA